MNKSVWMVTSGAYSDYRVIGIFSTLENAQRAANLRNLSSADYPAEVEEVPLDPGIAAS